ncbi:MAG: hypothetical protein Q9170_006875 [Blastenia crenularia]
MFNARLRAAFSGADMRVCTAFWLFGMPSHSHYSSYLYFPPLTYRTTTGLINNVLYVIILSAALDLVGPSVPKSLVLLADVIPSFIMKLVAPYFIHVVPYSLRVILFAMISSWGMLLIALTPEYTDGGTITAKMAGVVLASLSSGAGELSFLGLTHYYGSFSLAAWGSGTGGAGLIGAGAYAIATTTLGMSVKASLLASAFLPVVMLLSFFLVLPRGPLRRDDKSRNRIEDTTEHDEGDDAASNPENQGLLSNSFGSSTSARDTSGPITKIVNWRTTFVRNIRRSRGLFFPYILPLFLVYVAEYLINQSVAPTLLFPLNSTPFTHYRSFYSTYATIYQLGVFISRSSLPFFRIHRLYPPSFLQCLNLLLLVLHSLYFFLPSIYIVFAFIFWEGLLGGLVYVNTFAEIGDQVPKEEREFALGATTVSDSGGIMVAGVVGLGVETWLCQWQVSRGKDWCTRL